MGLCQESRGGKAPLDSRAKAWRDVQATTKPGDFYDAVRGHM